MSREGAWKDAIRFHLPFLIVLAAVLASRIWFAFTFPVVQISDYEAYYDEARGFAGLAPFRPTALNSIGPKLVFSVWFRWFGDGLRGIGLANTLFYSAALCLIYAGALRTFGRTAAALAALVGFFSLSEMYFINLVSSEILGALFIAVIYLLMTAGPLSWTRTLALGLAGGLALYNRSNILPMAALVLAHEMLLRTRLRDAVIKAALVQVVTLAVAVPLCFFNLSHFGRFTPLIANAEALWYGNNPRMSGDFHAYTQIPEELPIGSPQRAALRREFSSFYLNPVENLDLSRLNPYEIGDLKVAYALRWIASEPSRYGHLIWARFQFLFFACTYGEVPFRYYDASRASQPRWRAQHVRLMERARLPIRTLYQGLIASSLAGLILTVAAAGPSTFVRSTQASALLLFAFYSMPFLLSAAANRYHIPILNLAWIYLAQGVVVITRRIRAGGR